MFLLVQPTTSPQLNILASMEGDTPAQSPSLPQRTRASNADKHLGQILFESGLLQRRRTKAQKAEDDQCLKEAKASKEKVVREGLD